MNACGVMPCCLAAAAASGFTSSGIFKDVVDMISPSRVGVTMVTPDRPVGINCPNPMFIRFTVLSTDSDSGAPAGILVATHALRDEGELSAEEHRELRLCLQWFNEHLKVPGVLGEPARHRAISWFKTTATEPIQKMWELKRILDQHRLHVEVRKTDDPGTVIYDDEWQVVAVPRKRKS